MLEVVHEPEMHLEKHAWDTQRQCTVNQTGIESDRLPMVLFEGWRPDPSNGVYLGLRYGSHSQALAENYDFVDDYIHPWTAGRITREESLRNVRAHSSFSAASPVYYAWHFHDFRFHTAGMRAIARNKELSELVLQANRHIQIAAFGLEHCGDQIKALGSEYILYLTTIRRTGEKTLLDWTELGTNFVGEQLYQESTHPIATKYSNEKISETIDLRLGQYAACDEMIDHYPELTRLASARDVVNRDILPYTANPIEHSLELTLSMPTMSRIWDQLEEFYDEYGNQLET